MQPSGPEGKSITNFEGENGFGWEEWLFNEDFVIDGYQYGFIQGCKGVEPGELDNVHLFSYSGGEWTYEARIEKLEVLSDSSINKIEKIYESSGRWKKMLASMSPVQQATAKKLKHDGFSNIINVRFRPESLKRIRQKFNGSLPFRYRLYEVKPEMAKFLG